MANDIDSLAQGVGNQVSGTNTMFFIPRLQVPSKIKLTYLKMKPPSAPTKNKLNGLATVLVEIGLITQVPQQLTPPISTTSNSY